METMTTTTDAGATPGEAAVPAQLDPAIPPAVTGAAPAAPVGEPPAEDDLPRTKDAFNERIARARRSAETAERARLKVLFGTDDPEEIKRIRSEHEALRKGKDDADRAQMTREQQLEADLQTAHRKLEAVEKRMKDAEERVAYERQDSIVRRIAGNHVGDVYVEEAAFAFARELRNMPRTQAAKMGEKDIAQWFTGYVKKKPGMARAAAPRPPAAPRPITNGVRPGERPAPAQAGASSKTFRPGQQNSMSQAESRAAMRARGISY